MFRSIWICSRCVRASKAPWSISRRFQSSDSTSTIPPKLLQNARSIRIRHVSLLQSLEESYDSQTAKTAGELLPVVTALQNYEKANESLVELHTLLNDPTTDPDLRTLAQDDLAATESAVTSAQHALQSSLVRPHPLADHACLLEIRPGVGGSEAAIFAADLLAMYLAYCANAGFSTELLTHATDAAVAQETLSEVVIAVSGGAGSNVYARLRGEAGVHRVQRVPATETKGRVHTSTAAVIVLPTVAKSAGPVIDVQDPSSDFYLDPKEVRKTYMKSSGAGGQHVNKTESAVRLVHVPTGSIAMIAEMRVRARNEERAWIVLRSRVAAVRREEREEQERKLRRSLVGVARVGRGDKIRTYNWQQQRVTDHRSGLTIHGLDGVMEGGVNLEKLVESVRLWQNQLDIEESLAETNDS